MERRGTLSLICLSLLKYNCKLFVLEWNVYICTSSLPAPLFADPARPGALSRLGHYKLSAAGAVSRRLWRSMLSGGSVLHLPGSAGIPWLVVRCVCASPVWPDPAKLAPSAPPLPSSPATFVARGETATVESFCSFNRLSFSCD